MTKARKTKPTSRGGVRKSTSVQRRPGPAPRRRGPGEFLGQGLVHVVRRAMYFAVVPLHNSKDFWRTVEHTGIIVFQGPNGSGKSLAMVHGALPVLAGMEWHCEMVSHRHHEPYRQHVASGDCSAHCDLRETANRGVRCDVGQSLIDFNAHGVRRIFSTVPLLAEDGSDHPLCVPLHDYSQLLTLEHCDLFFDEVAGVSDASSSSTIPVQVVNYLHKLRKADVRLRCTTPDFDRCSLPIRQACQIVVDCRAMFAEAGTSGRIWRPRAMMRYRAYSKDQFMHLTPDKRKTLKPVGRAIFWRPGCEAERRYNTLGAVTTLAHVDQFGVCMACDGTRTRPKCSCEKPARKPTPSPPSGYPALEVAVVTSSGALGSGERDRRASDDSVPSGLNLA